MAMKKLIYLAAFLPIVAFGAEFGDIPANLTLAATKSVRRNSGNSLFEAFTAASTTEVQTLTNKRITPRIITISSSATPSINTDNADCVTITGQTVNITSMTSGLSGTPGNFDKLIIRIVNADASPHSVTWGTSFASSQATLPTTIVSGKGTTVGLIWDSVKAKWICLAVDQEP